jgi:predicted RNase H-like nuclease (RuvC/YqgF family)
MSYATSVDNTISDIRSTYEFEKTNYSQKKRVDVEKLFDCVEYLLGHMGLRDKIADLETEVEDLECDIDRLEDENYELREKLDSIGYDRRY